MFLGIPVSPQKNGGFRNDHNWVVVSKIFYFHPYLGKIPILTNIFQMGWNHQPDKISQDMLLESRRNDYNDYNMSRLMAPATCLVNISVRTLCFVPGLW